MGRAKNNTKVQKIQYFDKSGNVIDSEEILRRRLQDLQKLATFPILDIYKRMEELELLSLKKYGVVSMKYVKQPYYTFTEQQIEKLTNIFNLYISNHSLPITKEQIKSIFNRKETDIPICVKNNRVLAFLLSRLEFKDMLNNNWQEEVENNNLFSSKKGKLLKAKDLSAALARYRDDEKNRYYINKPELEPYKSISEILSDF